MGVVLICDLCKRPLAKKPNHKYRVKRRDVCWDDAYWVNLDVHDECMEKFLDAVAKEGDE